MSIQGEKDNPLVSILVDNYNYEQYIDACIQSCLNQSYQNIEIVIVDDGSQDSSKQVINQYKDQVIPIFKQNGGQSSAFNSAFQACKGDIILLLDSDDTFAETKVEEIVGVFVKHEDIQWCFHPLDYIDIKSQTRVSTYPPPPENNQHDVIDFRTQIINKANIPTWGPATSGLCFRRSILSQILPMPEELRIACDYYIRYASVSLAKGFFLNKSLASLSLHGGNAWTLQQDIVERKSKTMTLTAYWLQKNFPKLKKLSNKLLGWGIGLSWLVHNKSDQEQSLLSEYLLNTSLKEYLEIYARACFNYLKKKVKMPSH